MAAMTNDETEEVEFFLVREVEGEENWLRRQFKRVVFMKSEGTWSHRFADPDWRPRGRILPHRDETLEDAKRRLLESQDGHAYFEEPGDALSRPGAC